MYKRILAVDDDLNMLKLLNNLLEKQGYIVHTISTGDKVFPAVNEFQPDLILLDVMLDGFDGTIICSALKSMPKTQHIPVIFISGNYQAAARVYNQGEGAPNDFLLKPFNLELLLHKIEEHLNAA
jgi:DNA-binding response OmpR family regulator